MKMDIDYECIVIFGSEINVTEMTATLNMFVHYVPGKTIELISIEWNSSQQILYQNVYIS